MEAWSGRSRTRLIVVDFLATLFVTFCIGVGTAIALGACVVLMAGDAHGAAPAKAPRSAAPASPGDLILAHDSATKYSGLVVVHRVPSTQPADEERHRVTASRR
jgi:hypothetical protein